MSWHNLALLLYAVRYGKVDVLRMLMDEFSGSLYDTYGPGEEGEEGEDLLHSADASGNVEITGFLLERLNKNHISVTENGMLPVHYAARAGWTNILRILVSEFHADPYAQDGYKWQPIHYAVEWRRLDVVELLTREFDAHLHLLDWDWDEKILRVGLSGQTRLLTRLLELGRPDWGRLECGSSSSSVKDCPVQMLENAVEKDEEDLAKALIDHGILAHGCTRLSEAQQEKIGQWMDDW